MIHTAPDGLANMNFSFRYGEPSGAVCSKKRQSIATYDENRVQTKLG